MLPYTVVCTIYRVCWQWPEHPLLQIGSKLAPNEKQKKNTICLFIIQKCGKFWRLSLDNFIKHKSFFSEEYEAGGDWVVVQSQGSMAQLSQIDFHLTDETESAEICKKYNFLKGSS